MKRVLEALQVERMPSKHKALSSNPSTTKNDDDDDDK
jgi:hypothetical protein